MQETFEPTGGTQYNRNNEPGNDSAAGNGNSPQSFAGNEAEQLLDDSEEEDNMDEMDEMDLEDDELEMGEEAGENADDDEEEDDAPSQGAGSNSSTGRKSMGGNE